MKDNLNVKLLGYTANMQADKTELVIEIDSANPRNIAIACAKIFGPEKTTEPEQTTDEPAAYVVPEHKITKTTQIEHQTTTPRKCSKGLAWEEWELDEIKKYNTALDAVRGYNDLHHKYARSKESIKSRWNKLRREGKLNWQNIDPLKPDQKVRVKILGELREGVITKSTMGDDGNLEYLVTCGQTTQWTPRKDIEVL